MIEFIIAQGTLTSSFVVGGTRDCEVVADGDTTAKEGEAKISEWPEKS